MRTLASGVVVLVFSSPALAGAEPPPAPGPEEIPTASAAPQEEDPPALDFHFRVRGRFLDESSDPGDIAMQRMSLWSHTNIGERFGVRATWDVAEQRVHDLWTQFDVGGGFRVRAGRSAVVWLPEFTDPPFAFEMATAANGAALTRVRETGLFLLWDRGPWNARLQVVAGNGFLPDENSKQDFALSAGRDFAAGGAAWTLNAGHYEGSDGPDDALLPVRQTGAELDGDFGGGHFFRTAAFTRTEAGRDHVGAFARFRKRWPTGVWGAVEAATETNHGAPETPDSLNSLKFGVRYELPWVLTHIEADYRWHFGARSDQEVLVVFQWVLDFRDPRRN